MPSETSRNLTQFFARIQLSCIPRLATFFLMFSKIFSFQIVLKTQDHSLPNLITRILRRSPPSSELVDQKSNTCWSELVSNFYNIKQFSGHKFNLVSRFLSYKFNSSMRKKK
ncbi:hypothetical protein BpHYR1_050905 [Brachionus plicatilis]|uniref:Uncharacterized protein n=1 Tax=Brachionus plicatilis TaxID=10195 RepID=A0A3M7RJJ7_BRAPC|nr:hypothetical protein BpHYR1_050905 [Brachionus plicatilis]